MDEERVSYAYHTFTITTLRDDGVWWAKVRPTAKDVGGDRALQGGPWGSRMAASRAAQAFCDSQPAPVPCSPEP